MGVSTAEVMACSVCGVADRGLIGGRREADKHADVRRATIIARRFRQVARWPSGSEHSRSYGV